jgi:hypothetical protein
MFRGQILQDKLEGAVLLVSNEIMSLAISHAKVNLQAILNSKKPISKGRSNKKRDTKTFWMVDLK